MDDYTKLEEQIARCRRLAGEMTDDDARHALEALARDYERQLRDAPGFMLRPRRRRADNDTHGRKVSRTREAVKR